jgi:hypothetical protein
VTEENVQEATPKASTKRRGERDAPARPNEICLCGHSASKHTALRYTCQAAGDRKGYCPCMRFVARNSAIGKRTRAATQTKTASNEDTSQS